MQRFAGDTLVAPLRVGEGNDLDVRRSRDDTWAPPKSWSLPGEPQRTPSAPNSKPRVVIVISPQLTPTPRTVNCVLTLPGVQFGNSSRAPVATPVLDGSGLKECSGAETWTLSFASLTRGNGGIHRPLPFISFARTTNSVSPHHLSPLSPSPSSASPFAASLALSRSLLYSSLLRRTRTRTHTQSLSPRTTHQWRLRLWGSVPPFPSPCRPDHLLGPRRPEGLRRRRLSALGSFHSPPSAAPPPRGTEDR